MGRPRKDSKKTDSKKKEQNDHNKLKRPPSAFFLFMHEFREEFMGKNPNNKLVSVVNKAGGDKWKSMSDADKAPYLAKAEKLKEEYNFKMDAYNEPETKEEYEDEEEENEVKEEGEGNDEEEEYPTL